MRKTRADSKIGQLGEAAQEAIARECGGEGGLEAARKLARTKYGVDVSVSALSRWYSCWRVYRRSQLLMALARQSVQDWKGADYTPEDLETEVHNILTAKAAEEEDTVSFVKLQQTKLAKDSARTRAELEKQKLALAERRVAVMERKLKDTEKVVNDTTLSPEEQAQRIRHILGKE